MRFPPSFIDRLRSHFLLSEVIGRRIPIKKHGREYQGLCPFHNEKTPSFTINDEKNFFHCFGCSAHGDAIEFIMRYEKLTYPETIEKLARDAGIPLPQMTREDERKAEVAKTLYGVMDAACLWFERQLEGNIHAKSYAEKRGLNAETIKQFRIGYAPDERTSLTQHLLRAGFPQALQAEAGLIIVPDDGPAYDRFRGRLIFPIRNASGKVVAFGGRLLLPSDKLPKYLNSPETPLFKKGEMLYNLDLAKRPARDGNLTVVMEGYMDVVMSAQSGVAYAVATLGTAVTPEHLRLLWQLAKEPVMCLDGDEAGKRAMLRAAEVALPLLRPGYSLRFAVLPRGEDPDSYVQKHGRTHFEKLLTGARPLSQVLWEMTTPDFKLNAPEGRAALEDALKKLAGRIGDNTVKQHYLSYFRQQLWSKKETPQAASLRSHHIEHLALAHHSAALETLAQRLLKTLLQFPDLLHKSHVEETLSRLDIATARLDGLRNTLLAAIGEPGLDTREIFLEYIHREQPGDWVNSLIGDTLNLPWQESMTLTDAEQLWNETVTAHELAHLQAELKALQESIGETVEEDAYLRLVELQQAIHKAQALRTFAPTETDVA